MSCVHLQRLYQLCEQLDLKLGGSDLIRVVCLQCDKQEVCPSTLTLEGEPQQSQSVVEPNESSASAAARAVQGE